MQNTSSETKTKIVVVGTPKSMSAAVLLAFFFGPLGLLYSTVTGAIVMFLINLILFFVIPIVGVLFGWIGCVIWAAVAVSQTNEKFRNGIS